VGFGKSEKNSRGEDTVNRAGSGKRGKATRNLGGATIERKIILTLRDQCGKKRARKVRPVNEG